MSSTIGIGRRVVDENGDSGTVVGRASGGFFEVTYDSPLARVNIYGQPYKTKYFLVHASHLTPEGQGTLL